MVELSLYARPIAEVKVIDFDYGKEQHYNVTVYKSADMPICELLKFVLKKEQLHVHRCIGDPWQIACVR